MQTFTQWLEEEKGLEEAFWKNAALTAALMGGMAPAQLGTPQSPVPKHAEEQVGAYGKARTELYRNIRERKYPADMKLWLDEHRKPEMVFGFKVGIGKDEKAAENEARRTAMKTPSSNERVFMVHLSNGYYGAIYVWQEPKQATI